jgi:hypothetical protein
VGICTSTVIPRYTSNRFTTFRLYEMHKLKPVFKFTIQFSLIRAPASRKPIVVPSGSNGKSIFVLRVFALRAVFEEPIKLVNRGITVTPWIYNPLINEALLIQFRPPPTLTICFPHIHLHLIVPYITLSVFNVAVF